MKKKILSTLLLTTSVLMLPSCSTHHTRWKLVWTEDFKGKTIDQSVWSRIPKGTSDWDDMMSPRPDLAYIEDGQLVLLGKVNDHTGTDTTPFVTGGIWTHHKKSFRMARFEIRARFNNAQGFWPALWLMPDNLMPPPDYAEIDIMEHINFETLAHQTVHSHYTLHIEDTLTVPEGSPSGLLPLVDTLTVPEGSPSGGPLPLHIVKPQHSVSTEVKTDQWNTYATEIHPDSICFFVNGKKTMTYPRVTGRDYQFPWPQYPFYIILSNQLGGQWVGPVSAPLQLPSELRVDWIKVYEMAK